MTRRQTRFSHRHHLPLLSGLFFLSCLVFLPLSRGSLRSDLPEIAVPIGVSVGIAASSIRLASGGYDLERAGRIAKWGWGGAGVTSVGVWLFVLQFQRELAVAALLDEALTAVSVGSVVGALIGVQITRGEVVEDRIGRGRLLAETIWRAVMSTIGARTVVVGLGGLFVVLGVGLALTESAHGRPLSNVLVVALFVTVPGTALLYKGYRLPRTEIRPQFYPTIAGWCLTGVGLMLGSVALYQLEPAESISDPVRGVLVFTAFGSLAGFVAGSRDAIAKTRSLVIQQRNRELERTEEKLQETVDQLEATNEKLAESNERLDQFAYVVSHDLQEPLRMITSYLTLVEDRYGETLDEDGKEFIGFAVDGAERMRAMIVGLLELSRVETRGGAFEPVDLNEVLREVLKNLEVQIDETDATVEIGELPRVEGDREQLGQLFQNLLSNALEYSGDERPRVSVTAERDAGPEATISVRDEGIGIEPEDVERIFELFQRLHTQEEYSGTGIGLALCRRIVERHGGEICVDSEPGRGSTFSITLPTTADRET